jgi:uncharacterized protein
MAIKPSRREDAKVVKYSNLRWKQLRALREKAVSIMTALEAFHLQSLVHGSVARGDVRDDSDVDIFIPELQNSFLVETALEKAKIFPISRLIVQATPLYAMKAHIEIKDRIMISFPLMNMRRVEREFYQFGGKANLSHLKKGIRVPGVDKRLMFIEPIRNGHLESSILGKEDFVAKVLGISAETVLDRARTLLKRDEVGRTGVFIKKELAPDETFELAVKKLSDSNAAVRRRMKKDV